MHKESSGIEAFSPALGPGGETWLVSRVHEEAGAFSRPPDPQAHTLTPRLEQVLCVSITFMGPHAPVPVLRWCPAERQVRAAGTHSRSVSYRPGTAAPLWKEPPPRCVLTDE